MRYRLTAEVEGLLFAAHPDHPLLAEADGLRFEFRIDPKDARITHVSVSTLMTDDELAGLRNTLTPDATGRPTHIRISGDEALFHRLLACLRAIESRLAFDIQTHSLERIKSSDCEVEFVPESEEEGALVAIRKLQVREPDSPLVPVRIGLPFLQKLVETLPRYGELVTSEGFFREGKNHLRQRQFIHAFHDFYFVIEGMFANGKSGEKAVMKEFSSSVRLTDIVRVAIERFATSEREHWLWFLAKLREFGLDADVVGVERLLFRTRGGLRHVSGSGGRVVVTPFNEREYHSVALFTMYLAALAIIYRIVDLNVKARDSR